MKRRTPLKRSPMRRSRKRSAYRRRVRYFDYMGFVRRLPCVASGLSAKHPCGGIVHADHAGRRGLGRKAHDATVIPLCATHHKQRDSFSGAFRSWDQARMRLWLYDKILETQRFARARGVDVPTPNPEDLKRKA